MAEERVKAALSCCTRYRLAASFFRQELADFADIKTSDAYGAVFRVFLAFTAYEQFLVATAYTPQHGKTLSDTCYNGQTLLTELERTKSFQNLVTHRVEMSASLQTRFDVTETLPERDLSECHRKELVASGHAFTGARHGMQGHAAIELLAVNKIGDLSEYQASSVHPLLRINIGQTGEPVQMRHIILDALAA